MLCYVAGTTLAVADFAVVNGVRQTVGVPVYEYLGITRVEGGAELAVFCASIVGAGISFLWFNAYPASVFMGDVGSLALGGALGSVAMLSKNELVSAIINGVFLAELLSVMVQVVSFKSTGKRVFKMAPLHHHFEKSGMSETEDRRSLLDRLGAPGRRRAGVPQAEVKHVVPREDRRRHRHG